jgi:Fasciclin domain
MLTLVFCQYCSHHQHFANTTTTNNNISCVQLDAFERLIVENQSSSIDDLYDGMVLISRNGYSIQVEVNGSDIRVNGVSLHARERNMHYSNGYLHNLANFPFGFGKEWLGKSNYDVLLETNEKRGGDLSRFIELIDATDYLKASLMDESSGPMTVFCFVNDALSEASWRNRSGLFSALVGSNNGTENDLLFVRGNATSTSIDPSSELYQMLLNHIISKNFVRHIWTMIPGGEKVSDTELRFVTSARQLIDLVIEPGKPVVINGEATVIQEDILSEQGVVHVLNRPLYLY